jgi:hypothetical protein
MCDKTVTFGTKLSGQKKIIWNGERFQLLVAKFCQRPSYNSNQWIKKSFFYKKKNIFPQNGRTTMKTPRKQITKQTNKDSEKIFHINQNLKRKIMFGFVWFKWIECSSSLKPQRFLLQLQYFERQLLKLNLQNFFLLSFILSFQNILLAVFALELNTVEAA